MLKSNFDYLVFGANGQDGFFMTRYLLKNNFRVVAVIRNNLECLNRLKTKYKKNLKIIQIKVYNFNNFNKIYKTIHVRKIFFFSGFSKIPENDSEKKKCLNGNFKIFKLYIDFVIKFYHTQKILYISSSEIFGSNQKRKRNEKSKLKPDNFYGECKAETQKLIISKRQQNSLFISTAIAYNHDSILTPQNHLLVSLFKKFKQAKRKITIFNPNDYRNLSHVYDFLPIFKKILDMKKSDDFIMANDKDHKIIDIVKLINRKFYKNRFLIHTSSRKKFSLSRKADNGKIKKFFNFDPNYDIYKILKRFKSYYKKNLNGNLSKNT